MAYICNMLNDEVLHHCNVYCHNEASINLNTDRCYLIFVLTMPAGAIDQASILYLSGNKCHKAK